MLLGWVWRFSIVSCLWYDTDGQYKPWNDCGNLFLAATESTKLLHFSANGIQQAYNGIVFWYASFERYIFYSGY